MQVVTPGMLISCLLLANFSLLPQAIAQCLTRNDDMAKIPTSTDLSGILDFNLQLFREMLPTDAKRNFIFSSYSIWNALTLAYFGTSGKTEEQLRQVLRLDDKLSTLKKWRALEYMYKRKQETTTNNTFILANKAYFDTKIKLRSCMEDILHTEIEKVDFTKPNEAASYINNFVLETTRGTIKELVSSDDVIGANLVLANAAYFKGAWQYIFDIKDTHPYPFTGLDGTHYTVDMMQQSGKFKYAHDEELNVEFLELPYSGESISMLLLKPLKNTQSNFNRLVQGLSMVKFEEIISKMVITKAEVKIPKFKLDTTCEGDLLQALSRMGLSYPFDKSLADFTAFTADRQISLDKSIHKAFIDVNEKGTVAAAATGQVSIKIGGVFTFECNHPFVFVIRDHDTKNLLFMGAFKSSDKIDHSYKPIAEPEKGSDFPDQTKVNTNVNVKPLVHVPRKDGVIVHSILRVNKNPTPIKPSQGESNFDFLNNQFPTQRPFDSAIPPIRGGNQYPGQISPFFGDDRGSSSDRETNQNPDRNTFISGDKRESTLRRGSDQNTERILPSSGGKNELVHDMGFNSNPNQINPSLGNRGNNRGSKPERRTNRNPEQDIPFLDENRGNNRGSNPERRTNRNPEQDIPFLSENRGDNRGLNTDRRNTINPDQKNPSFLEKDKGEGRNQQNPEIGVDIPRPIKITPFLDQNRRNFRRGRSHQDSSEASNEA